MLHLGCGCMRLPEKRMDDVLRAGPLRSIVLHRFGGCSASTCVRKCKSYGTCYIWVVVACKYPRNEWMACCVLYANGGVCCRLQLYA